MYMKKMPVEIQLGIDSKRSRFIDCSDDFNHFIYELQRTPFGFFPELCSIWTSSDPRAEFYEKKILAGYLREEKKKIDEFKKKLLENSYEIQKLLIKEDFDKCFPYLSEFES